MAIAYPLLIIGLKREKKVIWRENGPFVQHEVVVTCRCSCLRLCIKGVFDTQGVYAEESRVQARQGVASIKRPALRSSLIQGMVTLPRMWQCFGCSAIAFPLLVMGLEREVWREDELFVQYKIVVRPDVVAWNK